MYSNSPLSFLLPPLTPEEYEWVYELTKDESEYYKLKSPPPKLPPAGILLIVREPYTGNLKVFYPDGSHIMKNYGRYTVKEITALGCDEAQVVKAVDHVWSFGRVYIRTKYPTILSSPIKTTD